MQRCESALRFPPRAASIAVDAEGDGLIRVFIGFDPRETVAYSRARAQAYRRAPACPFRFAQLALSQLGQVLTRERHAPAVDRFLVCALSHPLPVRLCRLEPVHGLRHAHARRQSPGCGICATSVTPCRWSSMSTSPGRPSQFSGRAQTPYAKKNWSSVMLSTTPGAKR